MFGALGNFITSLLSGHQETLSSTRFSFLICVLLSNMSVFSVWVYLSVQKSALQTVPESVIFLYCLANGITYTGKMVQKSIEKKGGGIGEYRR